MRERVEENEAREVLWDQITWGLVGQWLSVEWDGATGGFWTAESILDQGGSKGSGKEMALSVFKEVSWTELEGRVEEGRVEDDLQGSDSQLLGFTSI